MFTSSIQTSCCFFKWWTMVLDTMVWQRQWSNWRAGICVSARSPWCCQLRIWKILIAIRFGLQPPTLLFLRALGQISWSLATNDGWNLIEYKKNLSINTHNWKQRNQAMKCVLNRVSGVKLLISTHKFNDNGTDSSVSPSLCRCLSAVCWTRWYYPHDLRLGPNFWKKVEEEHPGFICEHPLIQISSTDIRIRAAVTEDAVT